jgi:hypothetical protein
MVADWAAARIDCSKPCCGWSLSCAAKSGFRNASMEVAAIAECARKFRRVIIDSGLLNLDAY